MILTNFALYIERLYAATGGRGVWEYTPPGGVGEELSKEISLECLPNPAKGVVDIRYEIPVRGKISLKLYDVSGRVAKILLRAKSTEPGIYRMNIDTKDLPNGVYFLRLSLCQKEGYPMNWATTEWGYLPELKVAILNLPLQRG